nr:(Fe-S)-binding protein [Thiorhodococcus minor]
MPTAPQTTPDAADQELLRLADQCVKCGYCLAACPTYLKTRNEADSPRGRIALVQGWVSGEIPMSRALARHLDGCLTCRACETVCPSLVAYGRLADGAKARRLALRPAWRRALLRRALQGLSSATVNRRLAQLARRYVSSGLARFAERIHATRSPLRRAYHRLAIAMAETSRQRLAQSPKLTDFDLFVGCTGLSAQGAAIAATLEVCRRLGLEPRIPTAPECCGAIMRHNGFPEEARHHREATAHQHAQRPLVGVASACIAELREQPGLAQAGEICAFIDGQPWPSTLDLEPLARRVLVHEPCSHRNLLGGTEAVYSLLRRIPEIDVAPMPGNEHCCGAAGTYLLQQPEMSNALLEDKLAALRERRPDIVVTTNPGCALHLIGGIQEAGLAIEVCHPVELIARQLPDDD